MTSVIGIFCILPALQSLHHILTAFSLPRAEGPMPHKYKHNLSYTSWLQDRTSHILPVERSPFAYILKWRLGKKEERERGRRKEGEQTALGGEWVGICKQGFHLICKNQHCSGINLHLSSGKERGAHLTVNGQGMAVRCARECCVTPQRTGVIEQSGMSHTEWIGRCLRETYGWYQRE